MNNDKMKNWNPMPDNDETWWKRSHCGPGTLNGDELCECGETMHDCAQHNTEHMYDTGEQQCGCSGFWCYKCNIFYPQDACWETYGPDYISWSGKKVILDKGYIHCACGQKLFKFEEQE